MPYSHNIELPPGDPRQEESAHRIAWAAVKRRYVKEGAAWVERSG